MNDQELISKVNSAMYHQCKARGYTAPVDVLMELGILQKKKYEEWRFGRVHYLEAVCEANLKKLSTVLNAMRSYASKNHLQPSFCFYKQWGQQGNKARKLQFSKSGKQEIEAAYATHYVDTDRSSQLKSDRTASRIVSEKSDNNE